MYTDENKSSSLAKLINQFDYVLLDTCSLMEDSFPGFLDNLANAKKSGYIRPETDIVVLWRCVQELKKHAKERKFLSKMIAAKRAIKIIKHAKHKKIISVLPKDKNNNFADNVIYTKVSADRISQRILVVTQDKGLAWDLRTLNNLGSQKGKELDVRKLLPNSFLAENEGEKKIVRDAPIYKKEPIIKKKTRLGPSSEIVLEDQKLKANLGNPNFPDVKKKEAIIAQINRIEGAGPKYKDSNLSFSLGSLKEMLGKLTAVKPKTKPQPKKEPVEAVGPTKPLGNAPHSEGYTIEDAIRKEAKAKGIIIRDAAVGYVKEIHGVFDITNNDVYEMVSSFIPKIKMEEKPEYSKGNLKVLVSRVEKGVYYCWMEEISNPVKPSKKAKKATKPKVEQKEKEPPKPKSKNDAKAPKKEKQEKPKANPKEELKETAKKEKPAATKKVAKPAKAAQKPEKPAESKAFLEAQQADKRLLANITNPNYPNASKAADVEKQIALLKNLSKEEISKLTYNQASLKALLAAYKN